LKLFTRKLAAYIALTKPRVIELLLITTVPVMILAQRGLPSLWLVLATLLGGALSAGSANSFNMIIDTDIDKIMNRTQKRPLVTGELTKLLMLWGISLYPQPWARCHDFLQALPIGEVRVGFFLCFLGV
jgi:protoheme IX farnesyltransferase